MKKNVAELAENEDLDIVINTLQTIVTSLYRIDYEMAKKVLSDNYGVSVD